MVLTEDFRPQTLDEVIGQEYVVRVMKGYKQVPIQRIPHMLFLGSPGVGKTTTAEAFARELNLNIETKDASLNRSVEYIRNTIIPLANIMPSKGERKIVFLDEFDLMSSDAQATLRRTMEKTASITLFILGANYQSKIIPAIFSRAVPIRFNPLKVEHLVEIGKKLLAGIGETGRIPDEDMIDLAKRSNGDARRFSGELDVRLVSGSLPNKGLDVHAYLQAIKAGDFPAARNMLWGVSYDELCRFLVTHWSENVPPNQLTLKLLSSVADYMMFNPQPDEYIGKMAITTKLINMVRDLTNGA